MASGSAGTLNTSATDGNTTPSVERADDDAGDVADEPQGRSMAAKSDHARRHRPVARRAARNVAHGGDA